MGLDLVELVLQNEEADQLQVEADEIREPTHFRNDLGAD